MIKKVLGKLKKVFIPRSEFIDDEPKKVEPQKPSYTGVVAPVVTPTDNWFSEPVKTEKVIAYEKTLLKRLRNKSLLRQHNLRRKHKIFINRCMHVLPNTGQPGKRMLVVLKTSNLVLVVGILGTEWRSLNLDNVSLITYNMRVQRHCSSSVDRATLF
jgi:hypothetical protein